MQQITGSFQIGNNNREAIVSPAGVFSSSGGIGTSNNSGGGTGSHILNFDSAGSSGARVGAETRPRNIALLACIKY
jgi:hypothetical protein